MNNSVKRVLISVAVAALIYGTADLIIAAPSYDAMRQTIQFLAGVAGGGCYWIGSNEHK